ncbi:MAG: HDOD domain-containing protein [Myxococcota bacterium]|nr:HDOD domain-containing protein [Myxococcota bacterium]
MSDRALSGKDNDALIRIDQLVAGRFRVLEKIGGGGMGTVYRAEQTSVQRPVALKVLNPQLQDEANLKQRFRNEASLASRLNHPNTVVIYDFGVTEDGAMFIAMELIEGKSLDDELTQTGAIPWKRCRHIAVQICRSLHNAHERDIIHRDLKPENIMLTQDRTAPDFVKVLDFGIAKILTSEAKGVQSNLTAPNEIFGTPEYMSPEQARGEILDNRTDIYSLGVILYRMLSGNPPFVAKTPIETLAKHLNEAPTPLSTAAPEIQVPPQLETLVLKALSKKREDRPASMASVVDQLLQIPDTLQQPPNKTNHATRVNKAAPPAKKPVRPKEKTAKQQLHETPAPAAPEVITSSDEDVPTIERLVKKMKRHRDFPVISRHLSELNAKVASKNTSAPKLANVILKDTALTAKLIRLVNSPFYGSVRGKVTMVSRAVVLMGFDAVRDASLGLLLFDNLLETDSTQARALQDAALSALMSGIIAQSLAETNAVANKEEAFVCGMFHNLGRYAAIFYFPKEMEQARQLMKKERITERAAAYRVLGVTLEELGKELAGQWDFPEAIRETMTWLPPEKLAKPRSKTQRLRHLAGFSSELTNIAAAASPARRKKQIQQLADRFGDSIPISSKNIRKLLAAAVERLEEYVTAVGIPVKDSAFVANVLDGGAALPSMLSTSPAPGVPEMRASSVGPDVAGVSSETRVAPDAPQDAIAEQVKILIDGVEEATSSQKSGCDLNSIMLIILETMYRGLGLSRIIFCLNDAQRRVMKARSGFGDGIESILPRFKFSLRSGSDLFCQTATRGRDTVVYDSQNFRDAAKIPKWYRELIDAPMFFLYPVTIKRFPAALFYGDMAKPNTVIDDRLVDQMKLLRNRAAQAIEKSYQFGKI